jgi:hypothetical protein
MVVNIHQFQQLGFTHDSSPYLNEKLHNAISTSHANQFVILYSTPVLNRVLTAHIDSSGPPSTTKAKITTVSITFLFTEFLLVNEGGLADRP